jgi:hypothetical protein
LAALSSQAFNFQLLAFSLRRQVHTYYRPQGRFVRNCETLFRRTKLDDAGNRIYRLMAARAMQDPLRLEQGRTGQSHCDAGQD